MTHPADQTASAAPLDREKLLALLGEATDAWIEADEGDRRRVDEFRADIILAALPPSSRPAQGVPDETAVLRDEVARLRMVIEADRAKAADILNEIKSAIKAREWLRLGRGSYEWDDDRWKDEFGAALDEILKESGPLDRLSQLAINWTDCSRRPEDIAKARSLLALPNPHQPAGNVPTPRLLAAVKDAQAALKRCPFCGGKPDPTPQNTETVSWKRKGFQVAVWCEECGALGPIAEEGADAVVSWNARAALSDVAEASERQDACEVEDEICEHEHDSARLRGLLKACRPLVEASRNWRSAPLVEKIDKALEGCGPTPSAGTSQP